MNNCGWGCTPHPETKNCSKTTRTRNAQIRRRNTSRKAARKASAEARRIVRECVAFCCEAATQSKWHGFQPICIVNSPSAVRSLQRTSDCYEVNRVSVAPREADAVGSLKFMQRGNGGRGNT